jgi:hypothetical protein
MIRSFNACAVSVLLLAGLAAGCASPTPYQPATNGLGYAEQPIEPDRYRVTFSGNSLTSRETVENYLLFRAAEVTLARGYDHFFLVEKETERRTTYDTTVTGLGGYPYRGYPYRGHPFYGPYFGDFATATARPSDQYAAYANVVMRHGRKPPANTNAYDARAVLERLGPTIARRPAS